MSRDAVHPTLEDALAFAQVAFEEYNAAERACASHAAQKALVRSGAILRIMQDPAPSGKPHSWTSAEALRDLDPKYAEYKQHEQQLASARGQREFDLFAARQRVEYLSRTLPPVSVEFDAELDRERAATQELVRKGSETHCEHGRSMTESCADCDAPDGKWPMGIVPKGAEARTAELLREARS